MSTTDKSVYTQLLAVTEDYLGPAAERFLERLGSSHLDKPIQKISAKDLPQLVVWIKLATMVITEDETLVNEYIERLQMLVGDHT